MTATPRPERPLSRIERIRAERTEKYRAEALARAASVCAALDRLGGRAAVTGSLADGRFALHSDIDFLVLDTGGISDGRILRAVEEEIGDLPFDLLWLDRLRPEIAADMLEKARAGPLRPA
jgi:predicted nucleotidyltransferase